METTVGLNGSLGFFNISSTVASRPPRPPWWNQLNEAFTLLMPITLAVIMFAMGCGITVKEIWKVLKRPYPAIIGAVCQFIILPPITFGIAHALQMSTYKSLGMLIWATCPGGTMSNMYTYWVHGDLSLSVTMTTVSTVLALGFMPLNLFIYSRSWTSDQATIPYSNIGIGLASILAPVAVGMLIRWKKPVWAKKILIFGSLLGLVAILVAVGMQIALYPSIFASGWKMYLAAIIMPLIGYLLGFIISKIFCQTFKVARTVAFETGVQNIALGLALSALSFSGRQVGEITTFIALAGMGGMLVTAIIIISYRIYLCVKGEEHVTGNMVGNVKDEDKGKIVHEEDPERNRVIKSAVAGLDNEAFCGSDGKHNNQSRIISVKPI